ncbi:MAG: sulfatase-like hydrolase/transferase [Acidobacteriia bacterium]|nr:sulfatase-like hydrolase/transferase [Terriglobia bacterium]
MIPRGIVVAAAAIAMAVPVLLGGCGRAPDTRGILLVTLDTTRADRIGCYGYRPASTPSLDALAGVGTRFDLAIAPAPVTLPSHASMFTGSYPPVHGVRYNGMFRLGPSSRTVAEILRDAGWATGAVPAAYPVHAGSGLERGFASYQDLFSEPGAKDLPPSTERSAEDVTRLGIEWLHARGKGRFFLWLHYYSPHFPYEPPFPFSSQFRDRPYDGEIAYADREIGKVFSALREMGLWDATLIVVAGDHGEGLYEHGEKQHADLVYQSTLHVPLIVKAPGQGTVRVVREPISLVDVAPTILDFAAASVPQGVNGISLRPALRGGSLPARSIYFESVVGSLLYGWSPLEGLLRGRWKYTRATSPELFDIAEDPGEANNRFLLDRQVADDLGAVLAADVAEWAKTSARPETTAAPLDRDALERLASLGYVGGTVTTATRGGPDPRTLVHLEGALLSIRDAMTAKEYRGALELCQGILKADPANRYALEQAVLAAARLEELTTATRLAADLVARYPEYVPGRILDGEIEVLKGDLRRAVDVFRSALGEHPGETALSYRLAVALVASRKYADALKAVEIALRDTKAAETPSFQVVRAVSLAGSGDAAGARDALAKAIAAGYDDRDLLESEPMLAPLRAIPGFRDEVGKIKPRAR